MAGSSLFQNFSVIAFGVDNSRDGYHFSFLINSIKDQVIADKQFAILIFERSQRMIYSPRNTESFRYSRSPLSCSPQAAAPRRGYAEFYRYKSLCLSCPVGQEAEIPNHTSLFSPSASRMLFRTSFDENRLFESSASHSASLSFE